MEKISKGKEDIFNNLDKDEFRKRIPEYQPIIYLVMIGVIQGAAFHLFAEKTFETFKELRGAIDWLNTIPILMVTGLHIITVTYVFFIIVVLLRWNLRSWDVLIVFGLGFLQMALFWHLELNYRAGFWLWFGAYGIATALSFWFTKLACSQSMFAKHSHLYSRMANTFDESFFMALLTGVASLLLWYFYDKAARVEYQGVIVIPAIWSFLVIYGLYTFVKRFYQLYASFYEEFGFRIKELDIFPVRKRGNFLRSLFHGFELALYTWGVIRFYRYIVNKTKSLTALITGKKP